MLATKYAGHYGIEAQHEDEDNLEFRARVADELREMGLVIEADEAYQDERQWAMPRRTALGLDIDTWRKRLSTTASRR